MPEMEQVKAIGTSLEKIKKGSEPNNWLVGSLTSIGEIGVEISEVEVTTLDSPDGAKEFIPGDIDPGELAFAGYMKYKADQQTAVKMNALIKANTLEAWKVTFPNGATWEFDGFVKSFKTTEATPEGLIGFSASIKISGFPVFTPAT